MDSSKVVTGYAPSNGAKLYFEARGEHFRALVPEA